MQSLAALLLPSRACLCPPSVSLSVSVPGHLALISAQSISVSASLLAHLYLCLWRRVACSAAGVLPKASGITTWGDPKQGCLGHGFAISRWAQKNLPNAEIPLGIQSKVIQGGFIKSKNGQGEWVQGNVVQRSGPRQGVWSNPSGPKQKEDARQWIQGNEIHGEGSRTCAASKAF